MSNSSPLTVWSLGHSKHSAEEFEALLTAAKIEVLVDVRTSPFSKMAPQFNNPELKKSLEKIGIRYIHMGRELGGRPDSQDMYDADGHVFYDMMAATDVFKDGLKRLIQGVEQYRVAMMCSEGSPDKCHRTLLVGRVLQHQGVQVVNILPSGTQEEQEDLNKLVPQQSLFGSEEARSWRSAVSVRPESQQGNSSTY